MTSSRKYESPLRKEQAAATRTRIMQAFSEIIVNEHPATVSVPEVAKRAGVSVRSVYHYFPTKESLYEGLQTWINSTIGDGDTLPPAHSPVDIAELMPVIVEKLVDHRELFDALRASGQDKPERRTARLTERREWMAPGLADTTAELSDRDRLKLEAMITQLCSFDVFERLSAMGLTKDEAIEVTQWAIITLSDRAKRTGQVSYPAKTSRTTKRSTTTTAPKPKAGRPSATKKKGPKDGDDHG